MSCFCSSSSSLCKFDGKLDKVSAAPLYVQQVFDAAKFNLQGMKTFQDQTFAQKLPAGSRVKRVIDIRCKKTFCPENIDDERNLRFDVDTSISGAVFLKNCHGNEISVVGADGTYSERIMYAETGQKDETCKETPVFGTQYVSIYGNVDIEIDLLICDSCNIESCFTICTNVNMATKEHPMVLTNFFEINLPNTYNTAFMPRFTEFCSSACEARLATNNCGRDLTIAPDGTICGNLIVAICLTCEKKIVLPVQICVLSTGYVDPPLQKNAVCGSFPTLFPVNRRCFDEDECECESDSDYEDQWNSEEDRRPQRPQPRR